MLRLLLMRHAKTEVSSPGGDHERQLLARGRTDAQNIARDILARRAVPDLILSSTAKRTQETAQIVAGELPTCPEIVMDRRLYLADAGTILQKIRDTDPQVKTLLVIAHNPGIAELANLLVVSGDSESRNLMARKYPTAALAVISLPGDVWQGASFHEGKLEAFVTAKSLRT